MTTWNGVITQVMRAHKGLTTRHRDLLASEAQLGDMLTVTLGPVTTTMKITDASTVPTSTATVTLQNKRVSRPETTDRTDHPGRTAAGPQNERGEGAFG